MKLILKGLCAAAAFALLISNDAHAQAPRFDISVTVNSTKTNGSPWDGVPRLGNSKLNLNAAPDIAICLARANAKPECLWRPEGRRLLSICQNAVTCMFKDVALTPLPIGLVFVDIDARNHDIIDVAILSDSNDARANDEIAESLRTAMTVLTPNRSENTKEHLVRGATVINPADCANSKPCRLVQSQFTLTKR